MPFFRDDDDFDKTVADSRANEITVRPSPCYKMFAPEIGIASKSRKQTYERDRLGFLPRAGPSRTYLTMFGRSLASLRTNGVP